MKFQYRAYDTSGKPRAGSFEADSADTARAQLKAQGLFVTSITDGADATGALPGASGARRAGKLSDLVHFARQLSVLVSTGTTLPDALLVVEEQARPGPWREVLSDLRRRVEEGSQLSAAMAVHPRSFDAVCRSLVAAGESRGGLSEMLASIADLLQKQLKIRNQLMGAMIYPSVLVSIALTVMVVMVTFVMPRFKGLFQTLNAPLPPTTKLLMGLGEFLTANWIVVILALAGSITGAIFFLLSDKGRETRDILAVRLPQIGRLTRSLATARIARLLGVLLEGKVSLLEALNLTRQATGNILYSRLIARAADAITRGEPFSTAFADPALVNPAVHAAIRSGERTGQIGPVLLNVADFMDQDNEIVIKAVTSVLEPLILVLLGLVVGGMAVSMFLPLFDLTASGGMGGPPQ